MIYAMIAVPVFVISALAPFAFKPLLQRWGVVDVPNDRSSHSATTLRAGGLAPLVGWLAGIAAALMVLPADAWVLGIVGMTAVSLAMLGFVDDLKGLPAAPRLGAQALIAASAGLLGAAVTGNSVWWFAPLGALLIIGYVNAANFMDGINGLSGLHGLAVGIAFMIAGAMSSTSWLSLVGAVIAAAFAGFLPWNLQKAGFFLGDVGSYLLGGAIGVTAILAIGEGVPVLLVLAPLAVYVVDTSVTMARRMAGGENIMAPHRMHAYQRLTDAGLSHVTVAVVVTCVSAISTLIAVLVISFDLPALVAWLAILVICITYLTLPSWCVSAPHSSGLIVPPSTVEVHTIPAAKEHSARTWAVVGASGFVGSAVVARLRRGGADVIEVQAPRLRQDAITATDLAGMIAAAARHPERERVAAQVASADVVINAAGLATPDASADDHLYGANALLPALLAEACAEAGVARLVHLSSAAVQGRRPILTSSSEVAPFSPYSHSKALGERVLLLMAQQERMPQIVVLRATSVQGAGRRTTERLIRLAQSPFSSVATPASAPSVTSSITRLAETTVDLGATRSAIPGIVLQPWEGFSTGRVLEVAASGRSPRTLPRWCCRLFVTCGYLSGRILPRVTGVTRRVEVMWFGQAQAMGWNQAAAASESSELHRILGGDAG
ncbi:NAD-dependent epimerase/dehydratase family protein [Microbacterium esteraromaticum]|uniref:NAD-dependent epimerase/dehydratase family protein n=1 Tax=Microbacterium esteraromaticum TaxID=57043 RepID=UPI0019D36FD0|nr:NAD-dependent epimerase/dehydratase family protein [Microbacterium esteraromaticum]MBN7793386.1 NAD-dependent epimerase/dehydratase family protein [Microbacterium esteraromaticum]